MNRIMTKNFFLKKIMVAHRSQPNKKEKRTGQKQNEIGVHTQ